MVALLAIFTLSASNAWSADDFINSTQSYGAGVWWTTLYGNVNYTNALSLRGDLGLKQSASFIADAEWQFSDKWGATVNYFVQKTTGSNNIGRNTVFNGANVLAGDQFNSVLNTSIVNLMARYSVVKTEDSRLDLQAGAKWISMDLSISKLANPVLPAVAPAFNFSLKPAASFLPAIGLSGKQRISERVYMFGDFSGIFNVGTGSITKGNLIDLRAGVRYNFQHPGWYVTGEYRYFKTQVTRTNGNSVNLNMGGPAITVRYEF